MFEDAYEPKLPHTIRKRRQKKSSLLLKK